MRKPQNLKNLSLRFVIYSAKSNCLWNDRFLKKENAIAKYACCKHLVFHSSGYCFCSCFSLLYNLSSATLTGYHCFFSIYLLFIKRKKILSNKIVYFYILILHYIRVGYFNSILCFLGKVMEFSWKYMIPLSLNI